MVHERVHLPERAELVGQALLRMVLLSTSELSIATGLSEDQVGRGLRDLQDEKFLRSAELGCLRPGVPLMWLTPAGLDQFGASAAERSWHEPAGVGNLILYDLSKVEAVNSIACWYSTVSLPLSRIWRYKQPQPMCAAAEYCRPGGPKAHIVFCRVSLLDNQLELFYHLAALPAAMQAQAMDPDEPFHPDELCLIAHDEWGAVQALQMACAILPQWVPPRCITAWYPSDGSWRVCDGYSVERGTRPRLAPRLVPTGGPSLHPSTSIRKLGKRKFERILERCHWAGRGGHELFRLLTAVGVYPVAAASHLKAFVGEAQAGTETNRRLRILVKMGLVEVVAEKARAQAKRVPKGVPMTISDRGQGADRYGLTTAGRTAFCSAHGGTPDALASRTEIKRPKEAKDDWTLAEHLAEHWKFRHEDNTSTRCWPSSPRWAVPWPPGGVGGSLWQIALASGQTGWCCSRRHGGELGSNSSLSSAPAARRRALRAAPSMPPCTVWTTTGSSSYATTTGRRPISMRLGTRIHGHSLC